MALFFFFLKNKLFMNSNKQFYKMSITSDFHCLEYFSKLNSIPMNKKHEYKSNYIIMYVPSNAYKIL